MQLLKDFITNVLKYKASLNIKFKCLCIIMCSLLSSPFYMTF